MVFDQRQRHLAFVGAFEFEDEDLYVSEILLNPEITAEDEEIDMSLIVPLRYIWRIAKSPFCEFLDLMGLSAKDCYERFAIPGPLVRAWLNGDGEPEPYLRLAIADAMGKV